MDGPKSVGMKGAGPVGGRRLAVPPPLDGNRLEERKKIESDSAAVQRLERSESFQLFTSGVDAAN